MFLHCIFAYFSVNLAKLDRLGILIMTKNTRIAICLFNYLFIGEIVHL